MKKIAHFLFVAVLFAGVCLGQAEEVSARLLRFPTIHGDHVVFGYGGDLYTVSKEGGVARRLTTHPGYEMFPRFSPDGKEIAFTGHYDGNTEVYLMPAEGGIPKRLTVTPYMSRDDVADRMGPNNVVLTWTPDGKDVVFRSRMRSFNSFIGQLYRVGQDGVIEQLPLPRGGFCSYSADGAKLAYNRIFREFRTWKRYRGGMADDVWIHDFETRETVNITDNPAQDIFPMWQGDRIYYLSDRGSNMRMNLYVYDVTTKETRRLTDYDVYDIKFPSMGPGAIVYELGGYLYRFDLETEEAKRIPVQIHEDFNGARSEYIEVKDKVTNYEVSPDGKRALFGARGEVFTVPATEGPTRNLTQTSGVHERNSKWSPDGRWIAYISDATGEDEIYIVPQDGSGPARQVTQGADTYKYQIHWSPDSKKILWGDKRLRLRYVEVETGTITEVDQAEAWEFHQYVWSPNSEWIAYVRPDVKVMNRVYLYSLAKDETWPVTEGWFNVAHPTFSADGKYLFFASDRDFHPIYSRTEWNHAYQDMARIYLVTLGKETESPLAPQSDEVKIADEDEDKEKDGEKKDDEKKADESKDDEDAEDAMQVDIEGIADRIAVLPVGVSNYYNLAAAENRLYYMRRGSKDNGSRLLMFDLKDEKETDLGSINGYEISANGKKMLVSTNGRYGIIDLPKSKVDVSDWLNLSGMDMHLDRQAEWRQIFAEVWRQMREFFYVPNLHGVDWPGVRAKYEPLVEHVVDRRDLTYILGEMISELNAGHTYVGGGDVTDVKAVKVGMLGAQFEKDANTGYFKVTKILRGQNWDSSLRSPLTEIGVDVSEGDYIIAVDGASTREVNSIYELLINKVGKQVVLTVNDAPQRKGAHEQPVIPIGDETKLYYFSWVRGNMETVNEKTDGKVGYIHIPDMGVEGLNEFVKHFYPQMRKKALIIDVRGNGGGNVSPMIIERLRREIAMITFSRNTAPQPNPEHMLYGPLVCLADEYSASDGDLFTYRFKKYKMGKVVGKRTWGGVVGIRGSLPLLDGGYLNKPEFSRYHEQTGEWIIENVGVEPDIYVDNDPAKEYAGIDQQLNKAIEVILEDLKTQEKEIPGLPELPAR